MGRMNWKSRNDIETLFVNGEKVATLSYDYEHRVWDGWCSVGNKLGMHYFEPKKSKEAVRADIERYVNTNLPKVLEGASANKRRQEAYRIAYL